MRTFGHRSRTPHGVRELKRCQIGCETCRRMVAPYTGCVSWKRRAIGSRHEYDDSLHEQIRLWGLSLFLRAKIAAQGQMRSRRLTTRTFSKL